MNNTFALISSVFLVGFVGYKTLSKNTDIHFEKVDKKLDTIEKDFYEEELDKLSRELVDDIINQVCISLMIESINSPTTSYDVCSICSSCSSFIEVSEVD